MTTFLAYGDAVRSPEMRHEIAEPISDPVVFIEYDGHRIVIGSLLEEPILSKREDVVDEFRSYYDMGYEELIADKSISDELLGPEMIARALAQIGVDQVVVPPSMGTLCADHLRSRGIDLVVDPVAWSDRRRAKSPWEIEGIEHAQRAAETAMLTAARMLREAEPTSNGQLRFEGEILTSELVREAMSAELLSQGAQSEEIIVQSGDACLSGHELGSGPILPDASCIIDCFPKHRRTDTYSDMTRTFVPGVASAEVKELHASCIAALKLALEHIVPGRADAYEAVANYFDEQGYPTQLHSKGQGPLKEGFFHALGHGVGLDVHEKPWIGRRSDTLKVGDVVAIEPGLYFKGVGGVRVEDTVLVTEDGPVHLTDPYPYDLNP